MIKLRTVIICFVSGFFACSGTKQIQFAAPKEKQNIILILADDLGRGDIAPYGNNFIETPNLTAMAAEALQFNNAYTAAPLCSPTRASIITGCNPARMNLTEHLHGYAPAGPNQKLVTPKIETGLPPQLTTIAEALLPVGYKTAHIGKWHLGMGPSSPANSGYQLVYGGGAEGLPNSFFYPFFNGKPYPNLLANSKEGDYLDDVLTSRAIEFINNQTDPFYLELNFYAPHVPIQGKPYLVKKYQDKKVRTKNSTIEPEYAAMVEAIDVNIGRVIQALKEKGLDKNTTVIFLSDNGALDVMEVPAFAKFTPPTSNKPLRGGKGYIYEGGIKAPLLIWSPSLKLKGTSEALVTTDDIFNTCMDLALLPEKSPDGQSILQSLGNKKVKSRNFYMHFPHYSPQRGSPGALVISGKYKLLEWYETNAVELYNLQLDPGEVTNIATQNKEVVAALKQSLDQWRKSVNAQMPTLNPIYKQP